MIERRMRGLVLFVGLVTLLMLPMVSIVSINDYTIGAVTGSPDTVTDYGFAEVKNPDTLVYAATLQPMTLDPAWAYDTFSLLVLSSCYDTLIALDRETENGFLPRIATEVPTVDNEGISEDGRIYTFHIRTDATFADGSPLTPEDVEYSFERTMVYDHALGPAWLFLEPLLGVSSTRNEDGTPAVSFADIDNSVVVDGENVEFHLAMTYPPFMQILAQHWASIVNKTWCRDHGDWDGTAETWWDFNNPSGSPLHAATFGSGPFMLESWLDDEVTFVRNDLYWRGPARLQKLIFKTVENWEDRRQMFIDGDADFCDIPPMYYPELEGVDGLRVFEGLNSLVLWALNFNFDIDPSSPYIGDGQFGDGIPPDFFTDIDVRKAFAYAFDYETYMNDVWNGEARQPATCVIEGLPFYNPNQNEYTYDLTKAEEHLRNAWGGAVWESGFKFTILYNELSPGRQRAAKICAAGLQAIDPRFQIETIGVSYSELQSALWGNLLPLFVTGWAADYPDPHNFVHSYMHSEGIWAEIQGYSVSSIDNQIDDGISTLNPAVRQAVYYLLQQRYHQDVPSFPIAQPYGRHYERDWVQGWRPWVQGYFVYPANPTDFYELWKADSLLIENNQDFKDLGFRGSGTESDPYMIEDLYFAFDTGNADIIEIRDTTAYFVIRNCELYGTGGYFSGIRLHNVTTGEISNNIINNCRYGVSVSQSSDITISGNSVEVPPTYDPEAAPTYGLYLEHSPGSTLIGNNISYCDYGICLRESSYSTINGLGGKCKILGLNYRGTGVHLVSSDFVTVRDYWVMGLAAGINAQWCLGSNIYVNRISNNSDGLIFSESTYSHVTRNIISENAVGIYANISTGNSIYLNLLIDNYDQINNIGDDFWYNHTIELGNFWSNYWGLDDGSGGRTAEDGIGDTDLPHEGVDWYPITDPSISLEYGRLPIGDDWWDTLTWVLVWRGGWSPVEIQVTDPLGQVINQDTNTIGLNAWYDEETQPDGTKNVLVMIFDLVPQDQSLVETYSFQMTALDDLEYSMEWSVSLGDPSAGIGGEVILSRSVEDAPLAAGQTRLVETELEMTPDGVVAEPVPQYDFSGVLRPIKPGGTSKFKQGISVPVKFKLYDDIGLPVSNAHAILELAPVIGGEADENDYVPAVPSGATNQGNVFRYDTKKEQYVFNLDTLGLSRGTYRLKITLDDGQMFAVDITLV